MSYVGAQTEEMFLASDVVRGVTASVRAQTLPSTGGSSSVLGSAELGAALDTFLNGWRMGIENMISDSDELALSLDQMAETLIEINASGDAS